MRRISQRYARRNGTILVVALVVLTFVILLAGALVRTVFVFQQQARIGERRQQALLLAESGIQRAIRAAAKSDDYSGESWRIPAEVLGDRFAGTVEIHVKKTSDSAKQRHIFVEATYPEQDVRRVVYRREVVIEVSPRPAAGAEDNSVE